MNYEKAKKLVQSFVNAAYERKETNFKVLHLTDVEGRKTEFGLALDELLKDGLQGGELAFWESTYLAVASREQVSRTGCVNAADEAILIRRERIMKGIPNALSDGPSDSKPNS